MLLLHRLLSKQRVHLVLLPTPDVEIYCDSHAYIDKFDFIHGYLFFNLVVLL